MNSHSSFSNNQSNFPPNLEQQVYNHASAPPFLLGHDPARSGQQFAYPVPGPMAYSENNTPRHGATSVNAEHMLRRKTPNGTINGAYESNAHEMQASKHLLVPRNDIPPQQAFTHFTQLDSVLHQAPYRQMQTPSYYGQTVPSVLQPPFQHLGPTASGIEGRGPYGPYWNDGTYIPYRPAAIRDSRFYDSHQQQPDVRWGGSVGYGRMSSWQNDAPAPLAYPVSNARNTGWPSLTHGGLALPHPYAPQTTAGFIQGRERSA